MGNGDGPAITPLWQEPRLFDVHVPFVLEGERAIISRIHADMYSGDIDKVRIEVRVYYPDRPSWKDVDVVATKAKPTGTVFYLPFRFYTEAELIQTIEEQEREHIRREVERSTEEAKLESIRMERRAEIDDFVSEVAGGLNEIRIGKARDKEVK